MVWTHFSIIITRKMNEENDNFTFFTKSANILLGQIFRYRETSDLWATLSDFGPPCFPATWPAKVCHHGSIFLLPRQVAQNWTKIVWATKMTTFHKVIGVQMGQFFSLYFLHIKLNQKTFFLDFFSLMISPENSLQISA